MVVQLPMDNNHVTVLFRLPAAIWADTVHVVGDFNNWNTSTMPMRQGESYWEANLTMEAGKTYYYAYLIDGVDWCTDRSGTVGLDPPPIRLLPIAIEHPIRRTAR